MLFAQILNFLIPSLLFLSTLHSAWARQPVDIVLDLDWTLISTVSEESARFDPRDLLRYDGKVYRMTDHTVEFLLLMHREEGVRVSFFSGGKRIRNLAVIHWIYAKVNERDSSCPNCQPFRVWNFEDLTPLEAAEGARFMERFGKDLQLDPRMNLERTLLVDDLKGFTRPGQEKNLIWLQNTYDDVPDFDRWLKVTQSNLELRTALRYPPPSKAFWALERNKLAWVAGVIESGIEQSEKSGGSSLRETVHALLHDRTGAVFSRSEPTQVELARQGLRRMGLPADPFQRFSGVLSSNALCEELLTRFKSQN